jgi:hypothetical protein
LLAIKSIFSRCAAANNNQDCLKSEPRSVHTYLTQLDPNSPSKSQLRLINFHTGNRGLNSGQCKGWAIPLVFPSPKIKHSLFPSLSFSMRKATVITLIVWWPSISGCTKEDSSRDMTDVVSNMRTRTLLFDGGRGLSPCSPIGIVMASAEWYRICNSGGE